MFGRGKKKREAAKREAEQKKRTAKKKPIIKVESSNKLRPGQNLHRSRWIQPLPEHEEELLAGLTYLFDKYDHRPE